METSRLGVVLLLFFSSFQLVNGQPQALQSPTIKELLEKGDRFFTRKDYKNALNTFIEAIKLDSNDASTNFRVGVAYLHSDKKTRSIKYLEKANRLNPNVDQDIQYHLGLAYQNAHKYAKAIEHFAAFKKKNKKFTEIANHKIGECKIGDSLNQHPAYVLIENLGTTINSSFHDYSPLLSADGTTMIFSSNRATHAENLNSPTVYDDIYVAHKEGLEWQPAEKMGPPINTEYNDAAASISGDGKTMFLYYDQGNGDIYISKFDNDTWTTPKPLNKNINNPHTWETSACIAADGKKLFFTSNRPGGFGELDIYVSELDANGDWGKAVNLGPTINTAYHEDSPFIHEDGVTLYFSSDGHPTMGSNDIFKSELHDGKWSKPINMGYPINSIEYDGFFTISSDKKLGYFSATREDGLGNADIYELRFLEPPKIEPIVIEQPVVATVDSVAKPQDYVDPMIQIQKNLKVVTVLKGKVIDETTAAPLLATITLTDNETQRVITKITSNSETGDFEIVIPHGGNYGVSTERDGYLFNSINFNLPQFAEYQEIDTHILMVKVEVGSKVVLKNIFFDVGKTELKPESVVELENMKDLLANNENLKVQINGHTDNSGNEVTNTILSLKRAEAVVSYLIEHGIDPNRLAAKGFGSKRPLVSNDDEQEGREINRRTEIEIISAGDKEG
jgi:outer membrane protein OmpA-like peptidoglycan-associated protein/tetratricopeptide (TPR) repeat protein